MREDLENSNHDHQIHISESSSGADAAPSDSSWKPIEGPFGGIEGYRDPNPADVNDAEVPIEVLRKKKGKEGTGTGSRIEINPPDYGGRPVENPVSPPNVPLPDAPDTK